MTLCFDELRWANVQRNKEWDPTGAIPREFRAMEMGGEAGEVFEVLVKQMQTAMLALHLGTYAGSALNIQKKLSREQMGLRGSRATPADLERELADLVITADLLAMDANIDLGEAVRRVFNATSVKQGLETKLPHGDLEEQATWPKPEPKPARPRRPFQTLLSLVRNRRSPR